MKRLKAGYIWDGIKYLNQDANQTEFNYYRPVYQALHEEESLKNRI